MAERLMSGDIERIVMSVIKAAKQGDMLACKLILDRVSPVPRPGDALDARLTRMERAIGMAAEEIGRPPQMLESDNGDKE